MIEDELLEDKSLDYGKVSIDLNSKEGRYFFVFFGIQFNYYNFSVLKDRSIY